jgi:hypothetical protein
LHEDAGLGDDNESDDEIKSISDSSDENPDNMEEDIDEEVHLISISSAEHDRGSIQPPQPATRSPPPPPLDSLIKILDPSSKYHNHYAQLKYHYSSLKDVYIMKIFIESEKEGCSHVGTAMNLINYVYPTAEEAAAVANKFSIGKPNLVVEIFELWLRMLLCRV